MFFFYVFLIQLLIFAFCFTEGLMGMAIVGGAALALGGLVGLGIALVKKK